MAETKKAPPQANGLTKMEAVRRALQDKGKDATPSLLKPYIKEKFGFDMTPEHITSCKTKVLQAGRAKKPGPRPKVQAATVAETTKAVGPPMTKFDGVKRALADLGPDAMPLAIQGHVKKHFGIDISTAVVSAYKKELKAKAKSKPAAQKKPAPKPEAPPAQQPLVRQSAPTPAKAAANGSRSGGISL